MGLSLNTKSINWQLKIYDMFAYRINNNNNTTQNIFYEEYEQNFLLCVFLFSQIFNKMHCSFIW